MVLRIHDVILIYYTCAGSTSEASKGKPFTQNLAYSVDGGLTFKKYAHNPLIEQIVGGNRDPKVIYYEPDDSYIMAFYLDNHEYVLYKSTDLIHWSKIQSLYMEEDAEWEALKHKMYTQEAIVPLLKKSKPGIWKIARIAAVIALIVGTTLGIQQAIYLFTPKTFFVCEAPLGDKSKIQLSDGTVVWLNAGSVLRYSNHFNTADRVVELEGEGYFEVTKQNGKQFTVKTHEYDVVVKGTKFNVSAYSDDSYITTTLLEGAVELNYKEDQIRMSPGESISLDLVTRQLKGKKVNARQAMAWAEDRIEYDDITLGEMVKKLSRQYDVHIQLESEKLGDMKFRVSLRNKETIVDVMDALKEIIPIKVEYKEKDIYIR